MATPSPGYSMILRVQAPSSFTATSEIASAAATAGAASGWSGVCASWGSAVPCWAGAPASGALTSG